MLLHLRLGPFGGEDQMIVTVTIEESDGISGRQFMLEMNVGESLAGASVLILGQEQFGIVAERSDQLLEVHFLFR